MAQVQSVPPHVQESFRFFGADWSNYRPIGKQKLKTYKDDPLEEPYEAVCQCSSKGCKWEFKDKNPCEEITEITCPSPDFNLWPPEVTLTCVKENKELFYIDVGDGCWRQNMLATICVGDKC